MRSLYENIGNAHRPHAVGVHVPWAGPCCSIRRREEGHCEAALFGPKETKALATGGRFAPGFYVAPKGATP